MPFLPCGYLSAHLGVLPVSTRQPFLFLERWEAYLLSPYGFVGCGDDGVFDAIDMKAGAIERVWICEAVEQDLHFCGTDLVGYQLCLL